MAYLYGGDISHHNGSNAVNKILSTSSRTVDFMMCKATEGKTYVDPKCYENAVATINNGLLLGLYHYARPDNGNSAGSEAANFLAQFTQFLGYAIPVLDWEDKSLQYPSSWALEWCDIVYESSGVRPVIYVQQSAVKQMRILSEHDYGLWVARWNNNNTPGDVSPWKYWALWQFTDKPFDQNFFNGSKEQFMKYCAVNKSVRPDDEVVNGGHTCGCSCGCCVVATEKGE